MAEVHDGGRVGVLIIAGEHQLDAVSWPEASGVGHQGNPILDILADRYGDGGAAWQRRRSGNAGCRIYRRIPFRRMPPGVYHGGMSDHEHDHHSEILGTLNPQHRALRQMIPDVYKGFGELSRAALSAGALETKTKELIAMTIGVVHGCDGCIASHARGAVRAGATKQEAAEAIGVSILMHGGPATIYGARAFTAFCEFADAAENPPG